jgi:hypothetical protein
MSRGGLEGPLPRVHPCTLDWRQLIEVEEAVVAKADEHVKDGQYLTFAGEQLRLAAEVQRPSPHLAAWAAEAADFRSQLCGVLGVAQDGCPRLSGGDVTVLVGATPVLRAEMFFQRKVPQLGLSLERGARVLVCLEVVASLARQAGMQEIRYQTVTHLFREFSELLEMLSLLDSPVRVRGDAVLAWPLGGPKKAERVYLSLVRALIAGSRRRHPKLLGTLLREHLDHGEVEHVAFLRLAARRLVGRVQPANAVVRPAGWRAVARARVQHWVLHHLDESILMKDALRRVAKATGHTS